MNKLELRSKFDQIYNVHLLFYRRRNMRPKNKDDKNDLSPKYLNNRFLEELKDLTDEEYLIKVKSGNQNTINKTFNQFYEMYSVLSKYSGLKNLLKKLTNSKTDAKIDCFISEFVIAYLMVKKNPEIDIEYEPKDTIIGASHPPDFKIKVNNIRYYVQVKSLLKSISYNENIDKQIESNCDLMVSVNNTPQVISSLKKATRFTPKDDNCFFIIIQFVSNNAFQSNDLIGDQLYGEEVITAHVMSDDNIVWENRRTQIDGKNCEQHGGFFYSENGKKVDAYIKATGTRGVFFPYTFEMFINDQKPSDKSPIYDLIDISNTYDSQTYFE